MGNHPEADRSTASHHQLAFAVNDGRQASCCCHGRPPPILYGILVLGTVDVVVGTTTVSRHKVRGERENDSEGRGGVSLEKPFR